MLAFRFEVVRAGDRQRYKMMAGSEDEDESEESEEEVEVEKKAAPRKKKGANQKLKKKQKLKEKKTTEQQKMDVKKVPLSESEDTKRSQMGKKSSAVKGGKSLREQLKDRLSKSSGGAGQHAKATAAPAAKRRKKGPVV